MWREPEYHLAECYLWSARILGITAKSKYMEEYPNLPSTI
jgi:hypothetical protein